MLRPTPVVSGEYFPRGLFDVFYRLINSRKVVSDEATFAYLADVYVLQAHRGKGLAHRIEFENEQQLTTRRPAELPPAHRAR